mmetsp:Transcript_94129/g.186614  ORF Transcript_94129/g.186614 Transcript_94129/m.186614 type:complete len:270 (-) Transcript_94129:40-849(-)
MRCASVARAGETHSKGGGGLPRQKLESVQVELRIMETFSDVDNSMITGLRPPLCRTKSRKLGESPAMLPSAQTACSLTSSFGDPSNSTKIGSAPISTTTRVCSAVPDAMFVKTQAASNCKSGRETSLRNCTKRGTIPAWITSWIGGFCSTLSILRKACVAANCSCGSSCANCWQRAGICSLTPDATDEAPIIDVSCMALEPMAPIAGSAGGPSSLVQRFFCNASSRVCFRSWTVASSRFRLASSASAPFLKFFCRSFRRSPKPDISVNT